MTILKHIIPISQVSFYKLAKNLKQLDKVYDMNGGILASSEKKNKIK